MNRQTLLAGLIVITLISNIILGIELYNALHKPSQPMGQVPINISNLQIITSNNSLIHNNETVSKQQSNSSKANVSLYQFSFKVKFEIHVKEPGLYLLGINPTNVFAQLYVILYFNDGQVVSLNLNHTTINVTIEDKDIEITGYITGESYNNLTPQQIFEDVRLYIQFLSPLTSSSNEDVSSDLLVSLAPLASTYLKNSSP
ncbi:MAG: hypothetical protein RQ872_07390 [Sulfolobaceae archaeon]|nr:hypothetical protein [Sulfolobaceae archaeon]